MSTLKIILFLKVIGLFLFFIETIVNSLAFSKNKSETVNKEMLYACIIRSFIANLILTEVKVLYFMLIPLKVLFYGISLITKIIADYILSNSDFIIDCYTELGNKIYYFLSNRNK